MMQSCDISGAISLVITHVRGVRSFALGSGRCHIHAHTHTHTGTGEVKCESPVRTCHRADPNYIKARKDNQQDCA